MCGRFTQKSPPDQLRLTILMGTPDDPRVTKAKARFNGAPSQELLVIRRHPKTGETLQDFLRWGLIPNWIKEANPRRSRSMPRRARGIGADVPPCLCQAPLHRTGRQFLRMEGHHGRPKQPYAIAMKSGKPFGIAGIWESWKTPETGDIHPHLLHHDLSRQRAGRRASTTGCRSSCRRSL